jgi:hypothetical protein
MFVFSSAEVTPKVRPSISCNSHDGHFFRTNGPKGSKSNQDYFIDHLLAAFNQVRTGNGRHKVAMILMAHMDNSICHNGAKITEKMCFKGLG